MKVILYKVLQQLVDSFLLTLILRLNDPDSKCFGPPSQASKFPVVEFSLLSLQNPVYELLPHLVRYILIMIPELFTFSYHCD